MSKSKNTHVYTFLLDIEHNAVKPPLSQFQHTIFSKEDVLKLLASLNAHLPESNKLSESQLSTIFETFWPRLEESLTAIKDETLESLKPKRKTDEIINEILESTRRQENTTQNLLKRMEICCKSIADQNKILFPSQIKYMSNPSSKNLFNQFCENNLETHDTLNDDSVQKFASFLKMSENRKLNVEAIQKYNEILNDLKNLSNEDREELEHFLKQSITLSSHPSVPKKSNSCKKK